MIQDLRGKRYDIKCGKTLFEYKDMKYPVINNTKIATCHLLNNKYQQTISKKEVIQRLNSSMFYSSH